MKKLLLIVLVVFVYSSNSIAQKKGKGWKSLFDGKSMTGWKMYKDRANNSWEVKDGALHCKAPVKGESDQRADLMTVEEFENFELTFDWKISPQGNSGVIYRVSEEFQQPYLSGPEYQVIDDNGYAEKPTEKQRTAGNYDMHAPSVDATKPVGEWNSSKIVVNGNHVEHWLNGKKVVEYEFDSEDWKNRKENSKWKKATGYGMTKKGHIDLQDHDHEVWYKNIMIKAL
ncbi:glycosyl hydrolase [Cytophagales bacterium WSM2-2]|nr:glycosyl hydrolase [Cytophagales bacterium WSM2-2]